MSIDDMDVVARLQAGADQVEHRTFDPNRVLSGSRRALRRRRAWQAVAAGTTAAAVAFSLALAGPIPVPGVADVTLPGGEQIRELFGLEADTDAAPTFCTGDYDLDAAGEYDLTVEWGSESSRAVLVRAVGHVIDEGAVVRSGTFENKLPEGWISEPDRFELDIANGILQLGALHGFSFSAALDDEHVRLADVQTQGLPDGTYIWWSASDLGSLSGVAHCGGLPLTLDGATSTAFTITSWNGDDSSGVVDCTAPPEQPTQVEREAQDNCAYFD